VGLEGIVGFLSELEIGFLTALVITVRLKVFLNNLNLMLTICFWIILLNISRITQMGFKV
jgi:hypothetical protein